MDRNMDWKTIEAEALAQVRAELDVLENTPLVFGDHLAWSDCRYGRTDGLSPVHRVGVPKGNDPYTTCGEAIPHPIRWITLCPAIIKTMARCRYCESEYMRLAREIAA